MSDIFLYIDYIGTFVFAVTGASIAGKSKFDFFGMLFLGFLTAVGGGTFRDLIIAKTVFWTVNPIYLYIIFVATLSTFFFKKLYEKHNSFLLFLDTLGLGTFVVIGTTKTLSAGFNYETAFIMGTISAVLGGILRSAFSKEHSILINRELYATVAGITSVLFIFLRHVDVNENICAIVAVLVAFIIRYSAIKLNWKVPSLED